MKKTVLAFAVAAAMGVPAVAAADTTLYGRFNVSLDRVDNDTHKSTQLASNSSRIGVRGSEDLGGGLRGVFQVEAGLNAASNAKAFGGSDLTARNTFLGLAGDFGEVRLGKHDTAYKLSTLRLNFLADTVADIHNVMGKAEVVTGDVSQNFYSRDDNMIIYMSPNFEGFQAMVSYVTDRGDDRPGANANDRDAYSLAGTYTNGPIFVTAAYENRNDAGVDADQKAWKIGGSYQIEDLTLAAMFENIEVGSADRDAWNISARYRMGQTYIAGTYAVAGDWGNVSDSGAKMFGLTAGYDLSRRTGVYAAYVNIDNDAAGRYGISSGKGKGVAGSGNADVTGFSVGVWHNF